MRKEFDSKKESFSQFSADFSAGDTAIFSQMDVQGDWLHRIAVLLQRGVIVRVSDKAALNQALEQDAQAIEVLARLGLDLDRKAQMGLDALNEKARSDHAKQSRDALQQKAHRLVVEQGLGVVAACRKVHCRPSDYYIYRSKLKMKRHV